MRLFIYVFAFLYSLSFSVIANESDFTNPNQVLQTVSADTFKRLTDEKSKLESDPDYIKVVIREELIPHFDYKYTAYSVVGPNLKNTTPEQRDNFVDAFLDYLINTYGHMLAKYNQQTLTILDNNNFKDKKVVSIPVRMRDINGQVTQLDFKLRKNPKTDEWKVIDVIAEGLSVLETKKSEFRPLIQKQGIDEVIQLLKQKNSEFKS